MRLSDMIEGFLQEALSEADGMIELQRSELAERFHCVPSQINYVVSTRFSPEHGYLVESRRGGGGYIRITRVQMTGRQLLAHAINTIGERIDERSALAILSNLEQAGLVVASVAAAARAALAENALKQAPPECRDAVRAGIFKNILIYTV